MTSSIRTFLLVNLLLSVTLVTSLAIIGNLFFEHRGFQHHMDASLQLSAQKIRALLIDENTTDFKRIQHAIDQVPHNILASSAKPSKRDNVQVMLQSTQFQIWDEANTLLLHSFAAPAMDPPHLIKNGFQNIWFNNQAWRIYHLYVPSKQYTISVFQKQNFRMGIENQITEDSIIVMVITYPFLGLLIWIIVGKGLNSIRITTQAIRKRKLSNLTAIQMANIPTEIHPLIDELNLLFVRLHDAFEREQRFAGDAAHELRTPLAALSTHVQVALNSNNIEDMKQALQKVVYGVDRSTHVVEQLLTLSRMMPNAEINEPIPLDLQILASDMIIELLPHADARSITLALESDIQHAMILGNKAALLILLRNLIDNAIRYSPSDTEVRIKICENSGFVRLSIIDNGPGIKPSLHDRVFERFYRVLGNNTSGSGLGLGIVKQIVELHRAKIQLSKPEHQSGLQVDIDFKPYDQN